MSGKGDGRRPAAVPRAQVDRNFDQAFGSEKARRARNRRERQRLEDLRAIWGDYWKPGHQFDIPYMGQFTKRGY